MSKPMMDSSTRATILDTIDEIRTHLDTIEMLDAEISEADDNPYFKDEAKTKACCELARKAVMEQAKKKLEGFNIFMTYGVKPGETEDATE